MTVLGDFYDFFPVFFFILVSIEKIYQTQKTIFDHSTKHLEVRQKYSTTRRIFNYILGENAVKCILPKILTECHQLLMAFLSCCTVSAVSLDNSHLVIREYSPFWCSSSAATRQHQFSEPWIPAQL